jgi:hypothetical protein
VRFFLFSKDKSILGRQLDGVEWIYGIREEFSVAFDSD